MKKIISLIMVVALLCAAVSALVSCGDNEGAGTTTEATLEPVFNPLDSGVAVEEGYGLNGAAPTSLEYFKYKELEDGTVKITGTYIEKLNTALAGELGGKLVVPAVVNGKKVSVLGETALASLVAMKELVLPDYIVTIDHFALRGCTAVETIKMPQYVTSLGDGVFRECSSLKAIDFLPNSISTIGARAFDTCTDVTKVVIPDRVTTIGEYSFVGCTNLNEVVLSKNLKAIPNKMFMDCGKIGKGLNSFVLEIPDSVTEIGSMAFYGCLNITEFKFSANVTKIGEKAFYECRRLATVNLPDSVKSIGKEAFASCQSLATVTLPGGEDVTIGADIFLNSKKLATINVKVGSAAEKYSNDWLAEVTKINTDAGKKVYTIFTVNAQ
jgi:hypothetical protein